MQNNIVPYKNRTLNNSIPVSIYRCLNKPGKVFSIKQGTKIVGHTDNICIVDAKFIVHKSGQERVRKTSQKNVHAFIKGLITIELGHNFTEIVNYNPFNNNYFMCGNLPIHSADYVKIGENGVLVSGRIFLG